MMLVFAGAAIFVLWAYILFIREWIVHTFPGGRIQWWHEEIEDKLWDKSRTLLTARMYQLGGWILALQVFLAQQGIDTTPFTTELANLIPEQYRPLAVAGFMVLTGLAMGWLRKRTNTSLTEKASSL